MTSYHDCAGDVLLSFDVDKHLWNSEEMSDNLREVRDSEERANGERTLVWVISVFEPIVHGLNEVVKTSHNL